MESNTNPDQVPSNDKQEPWNEKQVPAHDKQEPSNDKQGPSNDKQVPLKDNSEGINNWNDRLDENLETADSSDIEADEKAKAYSEKYGSGDQSDNNSDAENQGLAGT